MRELLEGIARDVGAILGSFADGINAPHSPVNDPRALDEANSHLTEAQRKAAQLADELDKIQRKAANDR